MIVMIYIDDPNPIMVTSTDIQVYNGQIIECA